MLSHAPGMSCTIGSRLSIATTQLSGSCIVAYVCCSAATLKMALFTFWSPAVANRSAVKFRLLFAYAYYSRRRFLTVPSCVLGCAPSGEVGTGWRCESKLTPARLNLQMLAALPLLQL